MQSTNASNMLDTVKETFFPFPLPEGGASRANDSIALIFLLNYDISKQRY